MAIVKGGLDPGVLCCYGYAMADKAFDQGVADFWDWFTESADELYNAIEEGVWTDEITEKVGEAVRDNLGGIFWEFGPPPAGKGGHSFVLTGEGDPHRRLLTQYCVDRAPELLNWTFHPARQAIVPMSPGLSIQIDDQFFEAGEIWVTAHPDSEDETIELTVWHPDFTKVDNGKAAKAFLVLLDQALGEDGATHWLSGVEIRDTQLTDAVPLHELYEEVCKIRQNWDVEDDPEAVWSTYELPASQDEEEGEFLRCDTIAGSSLHMPLIHEYLDTGGALELDPLENCNARFVFISMPRDFLRDGDPVEHRGEIEDAIMGALQPRQLALALGGAMGRRNVYMDFLLFDDGRESLAIMREVARKLSLPGESAVYPFYGDVVRPIYDLA